MSEVLVAKGRLVAAYATTPSQVESCQRLRYRCFIQGTGAKPADDELDRDSFDQRYRHVLVRDTASGAVLGTFRFLLIGSASDQVGSYAAQFHDLSVLAQFGWPQLELGRFCVDPDIGPLAVDVLRVAWAALTQIVDQTGTTVLFGCSSFSGTDPAAYAAALSYLAENHLGPHGDAGPTQKTDLVFELPRHGGPDRRAALGQLPPLLRTYLQMGGWVGGHGVIDRDLNTFHLLTAVEIGRIPADRARRLRDLSD